MFGNTVFSVVKEFFKSNRLQYSEYYSKNVTGYYL